MTALDATPSQTSTTSRPWPRVVVDQAENRLRTIEVVMMATLGVVTCAS